MTGTGESTFLPIRPKGFRSMKRFFPRLVLASVSPRRRELLGSLGVAFDVVPSGVDESLLSASDSVAFARRAAREKCQEVAARVEPDTVVLAADTVVHYHDAAGRDITLGKPTDPEDAVRMLQTLSGREHEVTTGVAVRLAGGSIVVESATTGVRFRALSDREIEEYVATGEPLDKAGAYGIQGGAGRFVEEVRGDLQNVIGLPVRLVAGLLSVDFPDLVLPRGSFPHSAEGLSPLVQER
jgi:septum formation protein